MGSASMPVLATEPTPPGVFAGSATTEWSRASPASACSTAHLVASRLPSSTKTIFRFECVCSSTLATASPTVSSVSKPVMITQTSSFVESLSFFTRGAAAARGAAAGSVCWVAAAATAARIA